MKRKKTVMVYFISSEQSLSFNLTEQKMYYIGHIAITYALKVHLQNMKRTSAVAVQRSVSVRIVKAFAVTAHTPDILFSSPLYVVNTILVDGFDGSGLLARPDQCQYGGEESHGIEQREPDGGEDEQTKLKEELDLCEQHENGSP